MSLKDQINEDMKSYMREKDTYALEAIRMLKADIKNTEIDAKKELGDEEIIRVIMSSVKKNKEAAHVYEQAGRLDLRDKENKYTETLSKYLPKQLNASELKQIVNDVLAEMGDIDPKTAFGAVMKAVMAKVGTGAEGKAVSTAVKEVLDARN